MERIRKTMASQLSEFDTMKKSLMRDLQNRCEKVCHKVMSRGLLSIVVHLTCLHVYSGD